MSKRILLSGLIVLALVTLVPGVVCAQTDEMINVKVPFAFRIAERSLPAGSYTVELVRADKTVLFRPSGTRKGSDQEVGAEILTRLGSINSAATLIFDEYKNGSDNVLSEVWFNAQEGFLIKGPVGDIDHKHRLVKKAPEGTE
jgi:hypothetical protein